MNYSFVGQRASMVSVAAVLGWMAPVADHGSWGAYHINHLSGPAMQSLAQAWLSRTPQRAEHAQQRRRGALPIL